MDGLKKKATLQHAESLKIYPMPSIFFCSSQSGGRPLRNVLSVISFGKVPIIAMWMISGVLFALFVSLLLGFGLLYIAVPLGLGFFLLTLLCFVAFCLVRTYRWWMHG